MIQPVMTKKGRKKGRQRDTQMQQTEAQRSASSTSEHPDPAPPTQLSAASLPQYVVTFKGLPKVFPGPTEGHFSHGEVISVCRLLFRIGNDVNLRLCTANNMTEVRQDSLVDLNDGPFVLEQVVESERGFFKENSLLKKFDSVCSQSYEAALGDRSQDVNDFRRAYSLLRWRCIHKTVATRLLTDPDCYDIRATSELGILPDVLLPESLNLTECTFQDEVQDADNINENMEETFRHPLAWCLDFLRKFQFSSNSKCEIQFHLLWYGILSATIGLRRKTPLGLFWEYCIAKDIQDPNIDAKFYQFTDLMVFYEQCNSPFAVLFVEVAGSRIHDDDDHKDLQKMISNICRYLSDLISKLRDHKTDRLKHLRVFGIFITRFAYDFVIVRPVFDGGDVRTVAFIVETDRGRRLHLVDRLLSSTPVPPGALDPREVGRAVTQDVALEVDRNRPIQENDSVLGICLPADLQDPDSILLLDELQHSIYRALKELSAEDLRELFKFGRRIREYCTSVQDLFSENLDKKPGAASELPRPVSGRQSSKHQTPSIQQRQRPSKRQARGAQTPPDLQSRLSSLGALSPTTIYNTKDVIMISFQRSRSPFSCVLKQSCRDSASHEVDMVRLLSDSRYVPFVEFCEWNAAGRYSLVLTEHLLESCPDVGPNIKSRLIDQLRFMRDLIQSLLYLHSRRVIHRDISPNNAMYSLLSQRYKLIDFEFACVLPVDCDFYQDDYLVGTKPYIDEYVCETRQYSLTSDWCSLGHVFTDSLRDKLLVDLDDWNNDSDVSPIFNAMFLVAASLKGCRGTPVQPEKLLTEIESIMRIIQSLGSRSPSSDESKESLPISVHG